MNEPIDPEDIKELIWQYRTIASAIRSRAIDPRNMGLDEHENEIRASIYDGVADNLEGLLR